MTSAPGRPSVPEDRGGLQGRHLHWRVWPRRLRSCTGQESGEARERRVWDYAASSPFLGNGIILSSRRSEQNRPSHCLLCVPFLTPPYASLFANAGFFVYKPAGTVVQFGKPVWATALNLRTKPHQIAKGHSLIIIWHLLIIMKSFFFCLF